MPVMGFDDERVRDAYWAWAREAQLRGTWDWQAALRKALAEIERREVEAKEFAAWLERVGRAMEEFAVAVVELMRPLVEVWEGLARACQEAWGQVTELARAWGLIEDETREAGRHRGPAHCNCRCMPVERVDPVRAGRTRWWTRK